MGIFDIDKKEKRTQLLFRDDGVIDIRKLELEDTFLQEKNEDGVIIRGWKHFYRNQFPFPGYKGIKADMVTLSFSRDIILDPYNLTPQGEKPDDSKLAIVNKKIIPQWLIDVGNARTLKIAIKRGKQATYDKIIWFLGAGFIFQLLIIGVIVGVKRLGNG